MEVNLNSISFDGSTPGLQVMLYEGITRTLCWIAKLNIKKDNQFVLHFNVNLYDEGLVDDWVYEGNFTVIKEIDFYYLTFINISRTGTSIPGKRETFIKIMKAEIRTGQENSRRNNECVLIMEDNVFYMELQREDNIKKFFDEHYSNMEHLKTNQITTPINYGYLTLNPNGTLEYHQEHKENNDTFNWDSYFSYKGTWTYDASARVIKLFYNSFKVNSEGKDLTVEELIFPQTAETKDFVFGKIILTLTATWDYGSYKSCWIQKFEKNI